MDAIDWKHMNEDFWKKNLRLNYSQLLLKIDTCNGLEGILRGCKPDSFPDLFIKKTWEKRDTLSRAGDLLDHILRGDTSRFKMFCEALRDDGQLNIVLKYLITADVCDGDGHGYTGDSIASAVDKLDFPISEENSTRLKTCWNSLVCNIKSSDQYLLQELHKKGVLGEVQLRRLKDIDSETARNEFILRYLLQGSERNFDEFCKTLRLIQQGHLVNLMYLSVSPTMTGNSFTPSAAIVKKMRDDIENEKAYDVTYCPTNPSVTRGRALIIANIKFAVGGEERHGTDADISSLKKLFLYLKFEVKVFVDLTAEGIRSTCLAESQSIADSSVFVLCILSHGNNGVVLGTDGKLLAIDEIEELFDGKHCQHLKGKPKLFFIQACQGASTTKGADQSDTAEDASMTLSGLALGDVDNVTPHGAKKHEKADIAKVLATHPGYAAYRDEQTGSFFIQHLAAVFAEQAHESHFNDMIAEVTQRLDREAIDKESNERQICQMQTTLTKRVYLLPY
jgi:hypothetical protein